MSRYRIGIDIGGTFTDHVLHDEDTGQTLNIKVPTTPSDLSRCFLEGLQALEDRVARELPGLDFIAHGTTVNTNAIMQRRGAKAALLTTKGFRDVLEIGRQIRPGAYDFFSERPAPLVPRSLRAEVAERIASDGSVVTPISEPGLLEAAKFFREHRVDAVAICFLNSYANPAHELEAKRILNRELPGVYIAISAEVSREFREFERTSTVVADAYVGPLFISYLDRLESELKAMLGESGRLVIMHSGGGLMSVDRARHRPHTTIESGPAAGVIAAAELGVRVGIPSVISFDMGGTTAKASLVEKGQLRILSMFGIGEEQHGGIGGRITGIPIRSPIVDVVECGTGGGSIAWVDSGGLLKVGPQSAGAEPGPACYDAGGTEPTVTDAHVVLGRLDPVFFLGGQMQLKSELAHHAVEEKVAGPLGMSTMEAAQGIIDVVNANMVRILRVVSIARGFDPRDFALVAFGGAGPLHAAELAAELGIGRVIVPSSPGLFSAQGMLMADLQASLRLTRLVRVTPENLGMIRGTLAELEAEAEAALELEQVPSERREVSTTIEMRYVGQNFELDVPVRKAPETAAGLESLLARFHAIHERTYGHCEPREPVVAVTFKVLAVGKMPRPAPEKLVSGGTDAGGAYLGTRKVFLKQTGGLIDCQAYSRELLTVGNVLNGPAIIYQSDTTTLVMSGQRAEVDQYNNLHLVASD
jgi:N-methylhydantoinase A